MTTFAEKLKHHRESLGLNQQQLADMIGVSKRMVAAYETENSKPRQAVLEKLAAALNVSVDYLQSTTITDPHFGIEKDPYVSAARQQFGAKGAKEVDKLLAQNQALFAGGALDQEAKDAFFEAIMKAYLTCKEDARKTFGRKNKGDEE